ILVSETDPRKQLLVLEVRRELERLLARLGAQRASDEQRARLRQIADGMDRAARSNDDIAFMRLDRELNLLISEAAHNDYAARAMRLLHGHSRRFWYMHYKTAADLPLCARLHAVQARAIADGEAKRAADATDRLIDYTETFTRATVAPWRPTRARAASTASSSRSTGTPLASITRSSASPNGVSSGRTRGQARSSWRWPSFTIIRATRSGRSAFRNRSCSGWWPISTMTGP